MYVHMVMSQCKLITACPFRNLVQLNTTMALYIYIALYMTVTRVETKHKAVEEVNQTVKSVFEQSL